MKRKKTLSLMFLVASASLFQLASFLIRTASCQLENPIVNVYPRAARAYVGLEVVVEATIINSAS